MKGTMLKLGGCAALALGLTLGSAANAAASSVLTLSVSFDGAAAIVNDEVAQGTPGVVGYACGVFPAGACPDADWNVQVSVGQSDPSLAPPLPHMDLTFNATSKASGAHTVEILLTDGDFTTLGPSFFGSQGMTVGAGMTILYEVYIDDSNTPFGMGAGNLIFSCTESSVLECADNFSVANIPGGAYSVTQRILISSTLTGQTSSGDNELQVPEPATLSLLGLALAGVAAHRRRARA